MSTPGERINRGEVIDARELLQGDGRSQRPALQAMIEEVAALVTNANVPKAVSDQLMIAKAVFISGHLFYELYTVAILHAAIAGETALKERYVRELLPPIVLSKKVGAKIQTQTFQQETGTKRLFELLWQRWRLASDPTFNGSLDSLISWVKVRGLCTPDDEVRLEALREWRNVSAHGGHIKMVPQGSALGSLGRAVDLVNSLFP